MNDVTVILVPRANIGDLIKQCADSQIPFSGPNSLCSKVFFADMGFKTTGLYEMLVAYERSAKEES